AANASGRAMPQTARHLRSWSAEPSTGAPLSSYRPDARTRAVKTGAAGFQRRSVASASAEGVSASARVKTKASARAIAERGSRSLPRGGKRPPPKGSFASRRRRSASRSRARCWKPSSRMKTSAPAASADRHDHARPPHRQRDRLVSADVGSDERAVPFRDEEHSPGGPAVTPRENRRAFALEPQPAGEVRDERRLSRSPHREVADGNDRM